MNSCQEVGNLNFEQADELNETIRAIGLRHRALAIAALAPLGIHPGHKLLLMELERGPRTQASLAAATGYEPPTITLSVRQLESAGFVARRSSETDGRATIVELTPEGRALLAKVRQAWRRVAEQSVAALGSERIESVVEVLGELAASLAEAEPAPGGGPRHAPRRG